MFPSLPPPRPYYRSYLPLALYRSLTCVFLASKTEEQITNVSLLAKATGRDDLQILGKELTVLQVNEMRVKCRCKKATEEGDGGGEV